MPQTELVFKMLQNDLSAPRTLLPQVIDYIHEHYGYPATHVRQFFSEKYPTLEDYEVDLTFSPQYTPAEHNRLEYIPLLGAKALSVADVALLKQRLLDSKVETQLSTPDAEVEITIPVHEMFIERYVNRLKLDQKLPEGAYDAILENVPAESHHEINLLARDDIWQSENRTDILFAFLRIFKAQRNFSTIKASFLTNFVRTYRPSSLFDLARQFDSLIKSCKADMENVTSRGFHDEYLKALNIGNSLVEPNASDIWAHYKHMVETTEQLKDDLQHLDTVAPDLLEKARAHQPA